MKTTQQTLDPQTGQSAPGTCLKDQDWTEQEKQLAEKYQVEPKLIRLLTEIVSGRRDKVQEPEPVPEPAGSEEQKAEQIQDGTTTGITILDRMLAHSGYETLATAYVCLKVSWANNPLGDRIQAVLRMQLGSCVDGIWPSEMDAECEILPCAKWLSFLAGMEAADPNQ